MAKPYCVIHNVHRNNFVTCVRCGDIAFTWDVYQFIVREIQNGK